MVDYTKQFEQPQYAERTVQIATTFKIVYGWMCAGLAISGVVAWYTFTSGLWHSILTGQGMIVCVIAELALVAILSAAINKLPTVVAYLMFLGYAALNGLTLSVVFIAYKLSLVQNVFFITAGMFGGFALFGTFTKSDLSSVGAFCGMALWGLIVALFVNMFLGSSGLDWIVTISGVVIFTGLTMYDAQKIRKIAAAESELDSTALRKVGILGALTLYLDFINLFLYILRFFGRRR